MTDEEVDFSWPAHVADLGAVPRLFQAGYEEIEGGFALKPDWTKALKEAEAEAEAEFKAELAERDARIDELRSETDRMRDRNKAGLIEREIDNALAARGVAPGLAEAAKAFLLGKLKIEVRDGHAVALDQFGAVDLASAVNRFLDVEGNAFLPPPPSQPGPAQKAMAQLRRTLH